MHDDPRLIKAGLDELNKGYPVSSGAGIVNDPFLKKNDLVARAMTLEQLREQGFDAEFPVVEPTYAEKFAALEDLGVPTVTKETVIRDKLKELNINDDQIDDILARELNTVPRDLNLHLESDDIAMLRELGVSEATINALQEEEMKAKRQMTVAGQTQQSGSGYYDGSQWFSPTPGYYTGYYANVALFLPEKMEIDTELTNHYWKTHSTSLQLRYVCLKKTDPSGIGGSTGFDPGQIPWFGSGERIHAEIEGIWYAMRGNQAFPNEYQKSSLKKPFKWLAVDVKDYTGYGNKYGRCDCYAEYNLDKKGSFVIAVLSGYGDRVTVMGEEDDNSDYTVPPISLTGNPNFIQTLGSTIGDAVGNAIGNLFNQSSSKKANNNWYQNYNPYSRRKKRKKKGWFPW